MTDAHVTRATRCCACCAFLIGALFIHFFVTSKSTERWVPEHYEWRWTPSVAQTRAYEKRDGMTPEQAAAARATAAAAADRNRAATESLLEKTEKVEKKVATASSDRTATKMSDKDKKVAEQLDASCPVTPPPPHTKLRRHACKHVDMAPEWVARVNVTVLTAKPPPTGWERNDGKPLDLRSAERFWTKSKNGVVSSMMGRASEGVKRSLARARARRRALGAALKGRFQPNMYIFVLDSVDRYTIHSNAPNFLREFRQKSESAGARTYEYPRHSTIGWGTSPNTGAIFRGCAMIPGSSSKALACTNGHPTLSAAFGAQGYAMMGGSDSYDRKRTPASHKHATERKEAEGGGNLYDGVFSQHVVERGCKHGRRGIDLHVELFTRLLEEFTQQDRRTGGVPRYFAFHDSEQHGGDGTCDDCLTPLLAPIDFANSIVLARRSFICGTPPDYTESAALQATAWILIAAQVLACDPQ